MTTITNLIREEVAKPKSFGLNLEDLWELPTEPKVLEKSPQAAVIVAMVLSIGLVLFAQAIVFSIVIAYCFSRQVWGLFAKPQPLPSQVYAPLFEEVYDEN